MAFRPDQGPHQVQLAKIELIESGAELIRLGPLDRDAVAQVATDVLGAEADEELLQKAARVQGNPFLLVEFFRGLQDDRLVSLDSGRATLVEDRLPASRERQHARAPCAHVAGIGTGRDVRVGTRPQVQRSRPGRR